MADTDETDSEELTPFWKRMRDVFRGLAAVVVAAGILAGAIWGVFHQNGEDAFSGFFKQKHEDERRPSAGAPLEKEESAVLSRQTPPFMFVEHWQYKATKKSLPCAEMARRTIQDEGQQLGIGTDEGFSGYGDHLKIQFVCVEPSQVVLIVLSTRSPEQAHETISHLVLRAKNLLPEDEDAQ